MRATLKIYRRYIISFLLTLSIIFTVNQFCVASTTVQIPIFSFHEIVDINSLSEMSQSSSDSEYTNTKQDVEKFLDYLVRNKYWFLSSQELYDYFLTKSKPIPAKHLSQRPIMLTFDDGYKGVHTNLLPFLEFIKTKYSTTAKLVWFVNPGSLGVSSTNNSLPHVTCDDLRDGIKKGFYDIQSHGFNHYALTQLNIKYLTFELAEAQLALRRCTQGLDSNQTVASHIAYPYGIYDARVETHTSKYYLSGYSYENRVLQVDGLKNKYQIPRLNIKRETSLSKMIQLAKTSSRLRKRLDLKTNFKPGFY